MKENLKDRRGIITKYSFHSHNSFSNSTTVVVLLVGLNFYVGQGIPCSRHIQMCTTGVILSVP